MKIFYGHSSSSADSRRVFVSKWRLAKRWELCTGNLPRGGLPRNSVDRITDRPDITSAVDRGRKALTQQLFIKFAAKCSSLKSPKTLSFAMQVILCEHIPLSFTLL